MVTHFNILAWKTPWTEEPGRPQPHKLGHDCATEHTHIQYYIVYMCQNFFIHSSVNEHLGALAVKLLQVVLQATLGYMCFFQFWFSEGICPAVQLLGHMVVLFLVFERNLHSGFIWHSSHNGCINLLLTNSARGFPFLHPPLQHLLFVNFLMMAILTGVT